MKALQAALAPRSVEQTGHIGGSKTMAVITALEESSAMMS